MEPIADIRYLEEVVIPRLEEENDKIDLCARLGWGVRRVCAV